MDIQNLMAIDVHTHAEVSSRVREDPAWKAVQETAGLHRPLRLVA